jgi:hypothetical protein
LQSIAPAVEGKIRMRLKHFRWHENMYEQALVVSTVHQEIATLTYTWRRRYPKQENKS